MQITLSGIDYLETLLMAGIFLLLLVLEALFPLRRRKRPWLHRVFINVCMSAAAFVVGTFIVKSASLGVAGLASEREFGLLNVVPLPAAIRFGVGFLLMDLTFYYWHRANHIIPLLWRFHNVHHIDPDMDVSTSFRFHFVEILYSTCFRVLQVGLLGIVPLTYVAYELCFQIETMFHHSNWRLPFSLEKWLNKVIVTPRMHGIHHSAVKDETNSNYSVLFRMWDSIHSTLRLNVPQSDIDIGVAGYQKTSDNSLWNLIALPFSRQREYWTPASGVSPERALPEREIGIKVLAE